jgi:hypothetical protein
MVRSAKLNTKTRGLTVPTYCSPQSSLYSNDVPCTDEHQHDGNSIPLDEHSTHHTYDMRVHSRIP